jgi:5-hydroxyisourate hydrolase
MSISTHILDISLGRPAANVPVTLSHLSEGNWHILYITATDNDGRVKALLPEPHSLEQGAYRIQFDTAEYYAQHRLTGLYPYVEIVFTVADPAQHYHIPLLLTANGYTTYRGS